MEDDAPSDSGNDEVCFGGFFPGRSPGDLRTRGPRPRCSRSVLPPRTGPPPTPLPLIPQCPLHPDLTIHPSRHHLHKSIGRSPTFTVHAPPVSASRALTWWGLPVCLCSLHTHTHACMGHRKMQMLAKPLRDAWAVNKKWHDVILGCWDQSGCLSVCTRIKQHALSLLSLSLSPFSLCLHPTVINVLFLFAALQRSHLKMEAKLQRWLLF